MYELIKSYFLSYIFVAAFTGCALVSLIIGVFEKTKNIERKKIKTALRAGISGVLVCLWAWLIVYLNLYPVSLAYYEYNHDITEEKIGVVNDIEQHSKEYMYITIDNVEYRIIHSSANPVFVVGRDIGEGYTVKYKYGAKSKFIFDIHREKTSP